MPRVDLKLEVDVVRTAKVSQLEGIFDMPEKKRTAVDFHFDVPLEERPWQVGLIVGPSGGGKTSVARHLWPDEYVTGYEWERERLNKSRKRTWRGRIFCWYAHISSLAQLCGTNTVEWRIYFRKRNGSICKQSVRGA